MEICAEELVNSASPPTIHQFTFKQRICVFCALPLDFQDEQFNDGWSSLNEETFTEGLSVLCDALNVKDGLTSLFSGGGPDNWRLLGIDNFVQWICCEKCYKLIQELVSLQQLVVKSKISLKENARKLENFVVSSEAPSLEYSVHACVLLRQKILHNYAKNDKSPSPSQPENVLSRKPRNLCPKQAVVLLERLQIPPHPIKKDVSPTPPLPIEENCEEELNCPSPLLPEAIGTDEDDNAEKDEDNAQKDDDKDYRPIKRRRKSTPVTRPKTGKPLKNTGHPRENRGKPGRPREIKKNSPPSDKLVKPKTKRTINPAFSLIEEDKSQLEIEHEKPRNLPSTKTGRPIRIGSRHYRILQEGSGPKLHAIYFPPKSLSPQGNQMEIYLMLYNVKFSKTSTLLRCLHPQCKHQEPLTGYFTDQTMLRNMRFHIRFVHRSPPKKDKPEQDKPSFHYCHSCDSQMDSKLDLLEHRRQLHSEDCQLSCYCEVCGDPNVGQEDMVHHIFSHKSELEKSDILNESRKTDKDILRPMFHPCDQCDKWFKCHTELMTHRNGHVPWELRLKFFCEICGKGFQSAFVAERHNKRVHLKTLPVAFECHVCGRGFLRCQKVRWKEHLSVHKGEVPYQCEQCGKRFVGKSHLTAHVRLLHEGERDKVTCEFCGNVYKDGKYLRKHCLKKHRDKVKIQRWLGEGEDKNKYKRLELRDDFIGPKLMFPCEPCGKAFIYKSMLITHLKNRHKMFYERKEDYTWQFTVDDASKN